MTTLTEELWLDDWFAGTPSPSRRRNLASGGTTLKQR